MSFRDGLAVILIIAAAVFDLRSRRIPNWLVLPFLLLGLVVGGIDHGAAGVSRSLAGIAVAMGGMAPLCYLGAMGMGDLKLCAAIGAWIGPAQMVLALVVTGMAGGLFALAYAFRRGAVAGSIDGAGDLLAGIWDRGFRPHPRLHLRNPETLKIPYAVPIAIGALFSFFAA